MNLPGNPEISAEKPLTLVGFREGGAGDWIIEQATHSIDKSVGFKISIEAVKSLSDN